MQRRRSNDGHPCHGGSQRALTSCTFCDWSVENATANPGTTEMTCGIRLRTRIAALILTAPVSACTDWGRLPATHRELVVLLGRCGGIHVVCPYALRYVAACARNDWEGAVWLALVTTTVNVDTDTDADAVRLARQLTGGFRDNGEGVPLAIAPTPIATLPALAATRRQLVVCHEAHSPLGPAAQQWGFN